jgi:ATPase complex subunit ATP10
MDVHRGKSFVSNARLFKEEKAHYFPNMFGETLSETGDGPDGGRDTTPSLLGKISVVSVQSGRWAEEQVETFLGKKANPELQEIIAGSGGMVQQAYVNAQSGWAQTMFVKLFKSRIRGTVPQEDWHRYFIVKLARDTKRGLTEDVRDAIGFLNSQVGYVYLLDPSCRIRWAGSGDAWDGETASLNAGVKRLLNQAQQGSFGTSRKPAKPITTQPAEFEPQKKIEKDEAAAV